MEQYDEVGTQIKKCVSVCSEAKRSVKSAKMSFRNGIILAANYRKKLRYIAIRKILESLKRAFQKADECRAILEYFFNLISLFPLENCLMDCQTAILN